MLKGESNWSVVEMRADELSNQVACHGQQGEEVRPRSGVRGRTRLMELGTVRMDLSGLSPCDPVPISQASTLYSGE